MDKKFEHTCRECNYCKDLYVPPLDAFKDVTRGKVCIALVCPMWLGDDNGFCEMFSLKKKSKNPQELLEIASKDTPIDRSVLGIDTPKTDDGLQTYSDGIL